MSIIRRLSISGLCVLAACLGLALVLGLAPAAHAQTARPEARAEARRLLREGNKAFDRGNPAAALEKFERALQVFPSARIQYNIGQALRQLGRPVEATEAFDIFLKDAERITSVERKETAAALKELAPSVARLVLTTNAPAVAVTIDNRSRGTTPLPADSVLAPGAHEITLGRAGYRPLRENITLAAGQRRTAHFNLVENQPVATSPPVARSAHAAPDVAPNVPPDLSPPLASPGPVAPAAPDRTPSAILATPSTDRSVDGQRDGRTRTVVGVTLLAGSAVLAAAGGILMGSAWSRFNDAEDSCGVDCDTAANDVESRVLWSKLLFGAAAVSGAGGAGVFLLSPGPSRDGRTASRGLMLVNSGRF